MFNELVELGGKGFPDADTRIFRAKLLGMMYEDLLKVWFKDYTGYNILGKDGGAGCIVGYVTTVNGGVWTINTQYLHPRIVKA